MKKHLVLLLIPILFCFITFAQVQVVDFATITNLSKFQVYPDVNGKVLITEDLVDNLDFEIKLDPFDLYPNWPIMSNGSSQRGGIYCNMDSDDDLEIVYNISQQTFAWNIDGSTVEGWPVSLQLYADGAPAFGDIDGDGVGEIVVSTRQSPTGNTGYLHAFNLDGSAVSGFPELMTGGATKTPVLADLNGDDIYEIIIEERAYPDGYIGVYQGDGSAFPGFPVMLDYIPASAVAVGDITGDNIPEIVAESYHSIYAFDINGNVLVGFPYTPGNNRVFSYSSPVLADLDGDGKREIIAGDHSSSSGDGAIQILKFDGTIFPGWPQYTDYWIYGPPAVADIDGDGNLDIAVGDQVLSGSAASKVYVWDKDGNDLPGWPSEPIWAVNNQIIIADLDGDDEVELIWDDNTAAGIYLGYNHDGTSMIDWPLTVTGSTFFMNPFVTDINNDGILDFSGGGINLSTYDLNFYLWNTGVAVNEDLAKLPILQYNVQHDGVYVDGSSLSVDFIGSPLIICEQEEVQFSDQSIGDVTSWDWSFEGGYPSNSVEPNPIIWYGESGAYDVSLTISDGADSQTITKTNYIKVSMDPIIPDLPIGPTEVITAQTLYTIYETSSPNATNYTWQLDPDDMGLIVPGDTVNQIKVYWDQSNSYVAHLSAKAENVCGESEFSDTLNIYVNWNTNVAENRNSKLFDIYPNPNNGRFTVKFNADKTDIVNLKVYSALNRLVYIENNITAGAFFSKKIALTNLNSGLYYLHIEGKRTIYFKKLVIQ